MSIETLFKITQKQAKIEEFVANLKKNPKQVSEYKKLVLNGGLEATETASMIADIPKLKDKGYIIDDIKISWEEHKKNTPEGVLPLKMSTWKNLAGDDFSIATSVKTNIYDDIGRGLKAKITHYSTSNGLNVSCGQNKPLGANVVPIDTKNPEDIEKFNNASKQYAKIMEEWKPVKQDIIKNRGIKYNTYMKLDEAIIERENQVIEKQKKAEYKQWLKNNEPPRIFSKPISQIQRERGEK